MRLFLVWLTAAVPLPCLSAPDLMRAPLLEYETGVFCPYDVGEKLPAPDTQLGYIHRGPADPVKVSDGTMVPARLGMAFGIRLRTAPDRPLPVVTVTVIRPAAPGSPAVTDRWTTSIGPQFGANRFKFEFPDEVVPGTWTFEVDAAGETLFRQRFDVVPDWMLPDLVSACFGVETLS